MQRAFNFKLLVPPRAHINQVSAVTPQDLGLFEDSCGFPPSHQSYSKGSEMETSLPYPSKMVLPMKTTRSEGAKKIMVMPMEKEEMSLRSSQLYARLLDEAEKIKRWKLRIDSEISQKDRKLQDNRRTIETQRKAIQEIQFANESLSMKLEDQLNENEELRNKNNATRNLCNILKDTFERSAEKLSLFEAERDEIRDLFIQNNDNIQSMVTAFESLRKQAEADQQDMLKLREDLTQLEDLKMKFESDIHAKEREVAMLQEKLQEKERNLRQATLKLEETKQSCCLLQESARQQQELLQRFTQEQEVLEEKLREFEQLRQEIEENQTALTNELKQCKENHAKVLQKKDAELEELNNIKELQSKQLAKLQQTANSLQSSLTCEMQKAQDLDSKICSALNELSDKNSELEIIKGQKEDNGKELQLLKAELDAKSDSLRSIKEKLQNSEVQMLQLITALEEKQGEANQLKDAMENAITENKIMEEALHKARHDLKELQEEALLKETKLKEIEEQLSGALESDLKSSKEVERLERDIEQHKEKYGELMLKFNDLQMQKSSIQQQVDSGALETKVLQSHLMESEANADKEKKEVERLRKEKQQLQVQVDILCTKIAGQDEESKTVQEQLRENVKNSQKDLLMKDKQIKALELKLKNLKTKLETKSKAQEEYLKEVSKLREESDNTKKHHKEELQKICSDVEEKSRSEAELNLEVQKLKQTATEALKSKDDAEIKCQQKISDMVALMERHKHEYDKIVEEKDAELSEKRMREAEINASKASLELELSHLQVENDQLRKQLEKVKGGKESLREEVDELKRIKTSQDEIYLEKEDLDQTALALKTPVRSLEKDTFQQVSETQLQKRRNRSTGPKTPKAPSTKQSGYTLLNEEENESLSRNASAFPVGGLNEVLKTPFWSRNTKTGRTPQIKSFRIRTPPTPEITESWKTNILELDPKSDSSDNNDILNFTPKPVKAKKPMQPKEPLTGNLGMLKKVQSSAACKSPGAALKLAAIKRMRDAGWTTVSSSNKKKKKAAEKIFA